MKAQVAVDVVTLLVIKSLVLLEIYLAKTIHVMYVRHGLREHITMHITCVSRWMLLWENTTFLMLQKC